MYIMVLRFMYVHIEDHVGELLSRQKEANDDSTYV